MNWLAQLLMVMVGNSWDGSSGFKNAYDKFWSEGFMMEGPFLGGLEFLLELAEGMLA